MTVSLAERLTAELRDRIITGRLSPGSVVIEPALAQEFQVSKTPVREALQRLTHEELVEVLPKRGYLVRAMSPRDLAEVLELRQLLEPLAAARVAEVVRSGGPRAQEILTELAARVEAQRKAIEPGEKLVAAMHFHRALADATPNVRVRGPLARALDESTRALYVMPEAFPVRRDDQGLAEHEALLAAIASGDPEAARAAAADHFARLEPVAPQPLLMP